MVSFFNLKALSTPMMIQILFDILLTVVAYTLFQRFTQYLRRFGRSRWNSSFRKVVDMHGKVHSAGNTLTVNIRRRATTPLLLGVDKLKKEISIPWLNDQKMFIEWTG